MIRLLLVAFLLVALPSHAKPSPDVLADIVTKAHAKFKGVKEGANADYIPILTEVPSDLFGIVIITRDGKVYQAGDTDYSFSIQSVSKPFNAALVMQEQGAEALQEKIGVEPTGLPFNSKLALEIMPARSVNPLVNAGAIASVSMVDAKDEAQRWDKVRSNINDFAGAELTLLDKVYTSEYETSWSNRGIANLLFNYGRLYSEPEEALRVYTKMCSLGVNTEQLAMMGATLANHGVNPKTGKRVLDAEHVSKLLAVMLTAGFYDESGIWSYTAGLPAKTGVGGGIVAVVPGEMAIAAFSPRLNKAGNSIRAMKAINYISKELHLNIFEGVK
ncbi:glutaminase [Oceanicoccus sagamiensis]|uniref:Glutaminase n=2 Tax=Oceanicoccus sagamiensis TaxID=716816 RepID=A0A1X9NM34_9GAMM|nr:glutaminase [Oceanicoccus sagamiensis]